MKLLGTGEMLVSKTHGAQETALSRDGLTEALAPAGGKRKTSETSSAVWQPGHWAKGLFGKLDFARLACMSF